MAPSGRYTRLFGFDRERRQRWLELLKLDRASVELARSFQTLVVVPHIDEIVADFYRFLLGQPETMAHLQDPKLVTHLRTTQARHLLSLGIDFAGEDYFEERLRVGATHRRVGLTLDIYLVAYAQLQSILAQLICRAVPPPQQPGLLDFMLRITALDIQLATETYHGVQLREIEEAMAGLRSQEERLRHQALTDELTGIPNRRQLLDDLDGALATYEHSGVLMIDLDHFKRVNDEYGHAVGDEVLRQAARRIRHQLRESDAVGRFGGEEFCAVLPGVDPHTMALVAERIRAAMAADPIVASGHVVGCAVSVGCALAARGTPPDEAMNNADRALYQAKRSGRNRVVIYSAASEGESSGSDEASA